jgi:ATP/maltotriose-dependent transcriptional regulator MalT
MAAVADMLARLDAGRGVILLLSGEAGIGKSRLISEAHERAARARMIVASGRADEIAAVAPLAPLLMALTNGTPAVVHHARVRALERPGDQRFWLLEELAEILEVRSRDQPVLITLDDLHWADDATIWAVATLARRLLDCPVGWILAYRPGPLRSTVVTLVQALLDAGAVELELPPLERAELDAIAGDAIGGVPDERLRSVLEGAHGNPFIGLELVNSLVADDAIVVRDGTAVLLDDAPSLHVPDGVLRRFAGLDAGAMAMLETASIFGRTFSLVDVARVRGVVPSSLVDHVEHALRVGVLEEIGGDLAFRHDLLRQAILERVHPTSRRALHRTAADAILDRGGSLVDAAAHLVEYAEPNDQRAVAVLQQAAASIASTAPAPAADLMLRAVELMPPGSPGWLESVIGTVGLLAWATRFNEANTLASRALAHDLDPMSDGLVRLGVSDALLLAARRIDLVEHARAELARPTLPDQLRGHFLHNLAQGLGQDGHIGEAERMFRTALELIGPDNESLALSCRIGVGLMTAQRGELEHGLELAQACVAACDEAGTDAQLRMPLLSKAAILMALDRFEDAEESLEQAVRVANELGAPWALEFTQRIVVAAKWWRGALNDAVAEAEAALAMADALDLWHDSDLPLGALAFVAFHRNDLEDAAAHVQRAVDSGSRYARTPPPRWGYVQALLMDARGSPADGVAVLRDVYDDTDVLVAALSMDGTAAPILVRLALRARDRDRAQTVVDAANEIASMSPGSPAHAASAVHSTGLLDESHKLLVAAATMFRTSPRLLARASASEDAGRALTEVGDTTEGAEHLIEAYEVYSQIGALRDVDRVRRRLRTAGIHRRPRVPPTRVSTGWESLTPAELRIVQLVSGGRTNRQIAEQLYLSPYTVGTHLKHVFTKLDLSSRSELAAVAARRQFGDRNDDV